MRKLILIALMVVFALSCQDKTRKKDDSTGSVPSNSEIVAKADINFNSNPIAEHYRTVITEKYDKLPAERRKE